MDGLMLLVDMIKSLVFLTNLWFFLFLLLYHSLSPVAKEIMHLRQLGVLALLMFFRILAELVCQLSLHLRLHVVSEFV